MILVKSCDQMHNDITLDTKEEYQDLMSERSYYHKVIDTETHEYLKDHTLSIEKSFLRRKRSNGTVFTIPLVKIFIDGNDTTLNKIFKKYWS